MLLQITLNDLSLISNIVLAGIALWQWVSNRDLKNLNKTQSDKLQVAYSEEKNSKDELVESRKLNQTLRDQLNFLQSSHAEKTLAKDEERKSADRKRRKEIQPMFSGTAGGSPDQLNIKFFNEGRTARNFQIFWTSKNMHFSLYDEKRAINQGNYAAVTGNSTKYGVNLKLEDIELEIRYTDIDDNLYKQMFLRSSGNVSTSVPELLQEIN